MKEAVGRNLISKLRDNSVAPDGLHHFDMTNAAIGPKDLKAISDAIKGNFQAIESGLAPLLSIELAGNSLCGVDLFTLKGSYDSAAFNDFVNTLILMSKLSRLKKINLSRNYFDIEGFTILGTLLSNGPATIIELYLQDCAANSSCIENLMVGLKSNKTLVTLDLRDNDIGIEGAAFIAEALQAGQKLRQLNLSGCNIESQGAIAIISSLSNGSIETLNLSDNSIGDDGASQIGLFLETNRTLKQLSIPDNQITDDGMASISKGLARNKGLQFLGVQWNFITNNGALYLSTCLSQNSSLRALHILGNAIDRDGVKSILEGSIVLNSKPIDVDVAGFNCCIISPPSTPRGMDKSSRKSRPSSGGNNTRPASALKGRK
eukprot:gene27218-35949_t